MEEGSSPLRDDQDSGLVAETAENSDASPEGAAVEETVDPITGDDGDGFIAAQVTVRFPPHRALAGMEIVDVQHSPLMP